MKDIIPVTAPTFLGAMSVARIQSVAIFPPTKPRARERATTAHRGEGVKPAHRSKIAAPVEPKDTMLFRVIEGDHPRDCNP
jgi:hypothetical protein